MKCAAGSPCGSRRGGGGGGGGSAGGGGGGGSSSPTCLAGRGAGLAPPSAPPRRAPSRPRAGLASRALRTRPPLSDAPQGPARTAAPPAARTCSDAAAAAAARVSLGCGSGCGAPCPDRRAAAACLRRRRAPASCAPHARSAGPQGAQAPAPAPPPDRELTWAGWHRAAAAWQAPRRGPPRRARPRPCRAGRIAPCSQRQRSGRGTLRKRSAGPITATIARLGGGGEAAPSEPLLEEEEEPLPDPLPLPLLLLLALALRFGGIQGWPRTGDRRPGPRRAASFLPPPSASGQSRAVLPPRLAQAGNPATETCGT